MTETRWWQLILTAKKDRITVTGSKARAAVRVLCPVGVELGELWQWQKEHGVPRSKPHGPPAGTCQES